MGKDLAILEEKSLKSVGFFELFRFATKFDVLLMIFGSIAAVINGVIQPLLAQFIANTSD